LARDLAFGAELGLAAMVIATIEGWLITPPLLGKAARMHTLAVFVGLLLWSWIWGIWGTILAVPMLAAVRVAADHVPTLHPLSLLLRE
jgi:predicted PurR-regulated permease PerM